MDDFEPNTESDDYFATHEIDDLDAWRERELDADVAAGEFDAEEPEDEDEEVGYGAFDID